MYSVTLSSFKNSRLYLDVQIWMDFQKVSAEIKQKGPHFVAKTLNFKPPLLWFAYSKIDALFFKRQEIGRSLFNPTILQEQCFCGHKMQLKRCTLA